MRLFVTGDIHFNKSHFQWIKKNENQFDCLCITGDLIDDVRDEYEMQVEWIVNWLTELCKPVFICSGNHDLDSFGECSWLENIDEPHIFTDNQIGLLDGIKFGCIPYLGADLSLFEKCDILLNHIPPGNTKTSIDKCTQKDWGDMELFHALKYKILQPQYLFCGHVEAPVDNMDTIGNIKIINPGIRIKQAYPQHLIININSPTERPQF